MSNIAIIVGSFDPICDYHLNYVKKLMKENKFKEVWFYIDEDNKAYCDTYFRMLMIQMTIKPYRKMKYIAKLPNDKENFHFFDDSTISTEQIRYGYLNPLKRQIRRFISHRGIYNNTIMTSFVNEKRHAHCQQVALLAAKIANANNLDSFKAYLMGMYHDVTKNFTDEKQERYIKINNPYECKYGPRVWHQYVGAYLMRRYFKYDDKEVLHAIRHHCLGDSSKPYDMILYVADKLDPSRGYDSTKEIDLACKDLKACFELVHKEQDEFHARKGTVL